MPASTSRDAPLLGPEPSTDDRENDKLCRFPLFHKHNHNIVVNIVMRCGFGLADGIWNGTVLAAILFHLGGNEYAGYAEAALGLANLVVALPAGWVADRHGKARVVFVGGLLTPIAVALIAATVWWSYDHIHDVTHSFTF